MLGELHGSLDQEGSARHRDGALPLSGTRIRDRAIGLVTPPERVSPGRVHISDVNGRYRETNFCTGDSIGTLVAVDVDRCIHPCLNGGGFVEWELVVGDLATKFDATI